jgi:hypothetical protein
MALTIGKSPLPRSPRGEIQLRDWAPPLGISCIWRTWRSAVAGSRPFRPNPFLKMNAAEKLASLLIPTPHRPPPNRFGKVNHSIS